MIPTIIGQKLGQTQRFTKDGRRLPVTTILAGPCTVVWQKEKKMQIAFGERKNSLKGKIGHVKKAGLLKAPLFLTEIDIAEGEFKPGDKILVSDVLKSGDVVNVIGISSGKGFAGVVKRWHFKGGPRTHGQSDRERAPGSIGQTTTPGRVYKGKKMAGRMGGTQVTIKNMTVFEVDKENNLVYLVGLVPGVVDSQITITKVKEGKSYNEDVQAEEIKVEEAAETVSEAVEEVQASASEVVNTTSEEIKVENTEGETK
jgi:large subunit ribosomal protein L3